MAGESVRDALTDPVPRNVWAIVVGAVVVLCIVSFAFRNQ